MPNYCFNGIEIKYRDDYDIYDEENIIDDIDFHLRNPIFDINDEIWSKIKNSSYTKPQEGRFHKFFIEKMDERTHANLIKYPLDKNDSINFNNVVEAPKDIDSNAWYYWRHIHWGTKWDGFDYDNINKTDNDLFITGCTAWSPCEPIVKKMSEMYPEVNIKLEYDEPGVAFCGRVEYEKGDIISEITDKDFKDYRHAARELNFDDSISFTCTNCGSLFYDFEVDDEDNFECDECGSHVFVHDSGYYVKTQEDDNNLYGEDKDNIDKTYDEFFV